MPELPEVETVRRHLQQFLPGQRVERAWFYRADLRYPLPLTQLQALTGATLGEVRRRSKYLLLASDGPTLLVHLGMTGRLFVEPGGGETADVEPERRKHEHWRLRLDGPMGPQWLRYVDARRFGALDVVDPAGHHPLLDHLGPEPLEPAFDAQHLWQACQGRQVPIKQRIMDGSVVVGIGNIYASESCFRARISPLRPAHALTLGESAALVQAAREVLEEAIAAGGSTLRDFAGGDEAPGYFQQRLDVYGRQGEPCLRCRAEGREAAVARTVTGQRATYWCPGCQA
jgi:formamidopyrimidine-DNA glycosylase